MKLSTIAGAVTTGTAAVAMAGLFSAPAHAAPSAAPAQPAPVVTTVDSVETQGSDCGIWTGGCSEIQNRTKKNITVARDWCGNKTVHYGSRPPCKTNKVKTLKPGRHSRTSAFKDTDSFAVPRGCTVKVQWNKDGQENGKIRSYRAIPSKGNLWIKVANNYDVDLEGIKC